MNGFDKSKCRQLEPGRSGREVSAFSVTLDGKLRFNCRLAVAIGAGYIRMWLDGESRRIYIEKAPEKDDMTFRLKKDGTAPSGNIPDALKECSIRLPARFEAVDAEEGAWACEHDPDYKFTMPNPGGRRMAQPRKKGLENMLP